MARMRNDRDRAVMLDQLLQQHMYGDEDVAVNAYPGGEDETREIEQRDINRAMPARVGSDSRRLNKTMEGYDNIKREAPPGTDADVEATEQLEEEGAESFNQPRNMRAPEVPKANDMFTPVVPPRRGGGRPRGGPVETDDANFGNEMSNREEMVPVPKRIVDNVMQSMMRSASRNSIGKSMDSDGQGYQQLAQNDGFDPAMARKMRTLTGASSVTSNPNDWQNDVYYMGSLRGAQGRGEVIGGRDNDNLKKRARNDR